jgi:hypothetical protein
MPSRLVLIENDGDQVREFGIEQRELVSLGAGQKDDTGGLVLHEAADEGALFLGELVVSDADIAEEDDVVFREFLEFLGKLLDVILAAAGAELRVEEQAGKLDAGVAGKRIAQEAVFPARQTLDDEHADFLGPAGDDEFARVVGGDEFAIGDGDGEFERGRAFAFEPPEDGVERFGIRRDDDILGLLAAVFVAEADDGADLAVERGTDGEGDLHVFPDDAITRRADGQQIEVRQARSAADGDGKQRHAAKAKLLGGGDGWLAEVVVAIAQQDDGAEVRLLFEGFGERGFEVGAGEGRVFFVRSSERDRVDLIGAIGFERFPEVRGEGARDPLRAGDDLVLRAGGGIRRHRGIDGGHRLRIVPQDGDARLGVRVDDGAPFRLPEQEHDHGGHKETQDLKGPRAPAVRTAPPGEHAQETDDDQGNNADPKGDGCGREVEH